VNIAFFSDIGVLGGGELWVLNMVTHLRRAGHQASVVGPHRSELFRTCIERRIDVFGVTTNGAIPFHEPLFQFLRRRRIDVLYCTVIGQFCEARTLGALVARLNEERADSKAILLLKTGLPPIGRVSPEYYGFGAGPEVRRLHVVSEENRRHFVDWVPEANGFVRVLREGVDLTRFTSASVDRRAQRAQWNIPGDTPVVACTARLTAQKGLDNLLLATSELARRKRPVQLVLAGAGPERERLASLAAHLGLEDCVHFPGHVANVPSLLGAADLFCHPSLADGLPNAVAEAMAMGLPVVASSVGGVPEIIRHEQNGLLVRAHDIHQLTHSLSRLLDDAPLARRLGAAAAESIRHEMDFSARCRAWEEAVAEDLEEYRTGATTRRAPGAPDARTYPVLFLLTHLRTGGEETETAILARYLDQSRYPMSVMTTSAVNEPSPAAQRLRALRISIDDGCHALSSDAAKVDHIVGYIRRQGIRIVVACQDTTLAYRVFEKLKPGECNLIEHAGIEAEVDRIPKTFTSCLVGVSPAIARAASRRFAEPGKTRYLPSMVDVSEYWHHERDSLRKGYGFGDDIVVTFVGRLDGRKGLNDLLDAAGVLVPELPNIRFLAIGPPDAYQPAHAQQVIQRAIDELPPHRFIFAGARDDVPSILRASDIFVLPSRGEGMSHAINEAGAAALPVVAYHDGAAADQLAHGTAGLLVRPGDVAGLVAALRTLAADGPLRHSLGTALRSRVLDEYSAQRVMPRWHLLFDELTRTLAPVPRSAAVRVVPADTHRPFPAEIQIETNTACNATCVMCPYPEVTREIEQGRMDLPLYQKILDECAAERGLTRIEPFLNNEPFTDVRMVDWIRFAKRTVPHAVVTVTTNGSLLFPRITDRLIHSGLDAIWFSFNGATRDTYEKIMGLSYDDVKANIDYLLDVRPPSLRVFTNMIDTVPMSGEIAENIRYWQSRGVQSGSSPFVNRAGNVSNFAELNYRPHAPGPARLCELLYHKMYIGWNGDALLCCMDWRRRVILGNVREQSVREIWNGEPYRRYRRLQEEGRIEELELCSTCSYIQA
jgi:radical SAM protein with 4Fe4S-binding SPASM domain